MQNTGGNERTIQNSWQIKRMIHTTSVDKCYQESLSHGKGKRYAAGSAADISYLDG